MINTDPDDEYVVRRGDRIAQLVVQAVEQVAWEPVDDLPASGRDGGFGHTGT
jgi:dUTP pyrophosphatase